LQRGRTLLQVLALAESVWSLTGSATQQMLIQPLVLQALAVATLLSILLPVVLVLLLLLLQRQVIATLSRLL
jgi:hypothetical protein